MRVTVQAKALKDALARMPSSKNSAIPVLNNVVFDAGAADAKLRIRGTDLDTSATVAIYAEVEAHGQVLLNKTLLGRLLAGATTITVHDGDKGDLVLAVDGSKVTVPVLPFEDFPKLPEPSRGDTVTVPGPLLAKAFGKVAHAITYDNTRYYMAGALVKVKSKTLEVVATDGHRLARHQGNGLKTGGLELTIPTVAIESAKKFLGEADVELGLGENYGWLRTAGSELTWKKIDANFPKYEPILKDRPAQAISVDRKALQTVVKRISAISANTMVVSTEKNVTGQAMLLRSTGKGDGVQIRHELGAKWDGGDIEVGLNPKYVLQALAAIEADEVQIPVKDGDSAVFILGDDDLAEVLMPVRV